MALASGYNVPDTQFWRPADMLYWQLSAYGEYGRHLYLTRVSPVDIFVPSAQALFLSVAITLVFQHLFPKDSRWQMLNLLPFPAMLGDYLENWSLIALILIYPNRLDNLAVASAVFTAIKWLFTVASMICVASAGCILFGLAFRLTKEIQGK